MTNELGAKRIEWVDIFKALVIISVVIGHSTGKYNMLIYQCHMAAFFFISGYTTDLKKRGFFDLIWNKACTMLLPLISIFVIGLIFVAALDQFGLYQYLFTDPFVGIQVAVQQYIHNGNNFVLWMGATWFLIVLFLVVALHKLLHQFFGNRITIGYVVVSVMIFLLGYYLVGHNIRGQVSIFMLDLPLIAQFYFFSGLFAKQKMVLENLSSKKLLLFIGFVLSVAIMFYFGVVNPTTVDYPSRRFGFFVADAIAALNGTMVFYYLARFLVCLPSKTKKWIAYIGRNTIGILFLHFMFFNAGFGILIASKIVPLSYLQNFIPTDEIGSKYWFLFVVVSIPLSLLLWKVMNLTKPMRVILGQEKGIYSQVFNKLARLSIFAKLSEKKCPITYEWIEKKHIDFVRCISANKWVALIITTLLTCVASPIAVMGITLNDELQQRFRGMQGLFISIQEGLRLELQQGRPMRILAPINVAIGFIQSNVYIYKSVQICMLVLAISLFGFFLYTLFGNKKFSLFTSISILVFLPITFEHAVPNAFITLLSVPMIFLLLSLICFAYYVNAEKLTYLVVSMAFFVVSMLGYEFIVTFVLLYPVIYFMKASKERRDIRNIARHSAVPSCFGVLYLVSLLGLNVLIKQHYAGAQIGFVSLKSSFAIIATLFKSVLPGYYLFNSKYEFLFNLYSDNPFPISRALLSDAAGNGIFSNIALIGDSFGKYILGNMLNMRILLLIVFLFLLLIFLLPKGGRQEVKWSTWIPAVVGIAYMIIPALTISVSEMYQGNVSAEVFTSLPVSFFLYFSAMFTISYITWVILKTVSSRHATIAVAVVLCLYCLPVQAMNSTFSRVHSENYERLILIEQLFDSATITNLNNQSVYAQDFYLTYNALAVHGGYWSQYANYKGLKLDITNGEMPQGEQFQIYLQDDMYFVICADNEISVLSPNRLRGIRAIQISEDKFVSADFNNEASDGSFYRYNFLLNEDKSAALETDNTIIPFANLSTEAGNTLKTTLMLYGYYSDGWLEKAAEFKIKTGEEGKVILNGYYPNEITGNESGVVYIDGQANRFEISEAIFTLELPAKSNSVVTVKIENDFVFQAAAPDIRKLSFVLSDAQGK